MQAIRCNSDFDRWMEILLKLVVAIIFFCNRCCLFAFAEKTARNEDTFSFAIFFPNSLQIVMQNFATTFRFH